SALFCIGASASDYYLLSLPDALPIFSGLSDSTTLGSTYAARMADASGVTDEAQKMAARREVRQWTRQVYRDEIDARMSAALTTPTPFIERLVHFWSNHFAISVQKPQVY